MSIEVFPSPQSFLKTAAIIRDASVRRHPSISTPGRGLVEITRDVVDWLRPHQVRTGLLTLFCRHTSAGLLIQENAARDVRADLETFFERIAPEDAGRYRHADEGATTCRPTSERR